VQGTLANPNGAPGPEGPDEALHGLFIQNRQNLFSLLWTKPQFGFESPAELKLAKNSLIFADNSYNLDIHNEALVFLHVKTYDGRIFLTLILVDFIYADNTDLTHVSGARLGRYLTGDSTGGAGET
jgi:hypothetical protein